MEGYDPLHETAVQPFVWAPGWNSNQSLHKFQAEIGGAMRTANGGVRLLDTHAEEPPAAPEPAPAPAAAVDSDSTWLLLPRPVLFGSERLSALSTGIDELLPRAFIAVTPTAAQHLGVSAGDGLRVRGHEAALEVRIDPSLPEGYAAYAHNFPECRDLIPGVRAELERCADWRRTDADLIARSGGAHG
jgi:NADH-quinone oxidoreductase subunit G